MEATTRKTYKYKPTPTQEQAIDTVLWRCRELYNEGLEERKTAYQRRGVSISYSQQKVDLPGIKEAMPEYAEVNAQVLQDVLHRLELAFQAFFRRVKAGEKAGYPPLSGPQPLQ